MRSTIAALVVPLALSACRRSEQPRGSDASSSSTPIALAPASASAPVPIPATASTHCHGAPPAPKKDDSKSPVKSHDGLATVWAETEPSDTTDQDLTAWLCFERGGNRKVLLQTRPSDGGVETGLADFEDFVFSRDDRVVFFTTSAWAVSRAAHGVEVATGKEYFITDGAIIEELDRGPYKGSLYASHFRLDEDHKPGDPGYTGRGVVLDIIDWHGKRLAKVPDEGGDLKERKRLLGR